MFGIWMFGSYAKLILAHPDDIEAVRLLHPQAKADPHIERGTVIVVDNRMFEPPDVPMTTVPFLDCSGLGLSRSLLITTNSIPMFDPRPFIMPRYLGRDSRLYTAWSNRRRRSMASQAQRQANKILRQSWRIAK